ncbi:MAG: putative peptidoglycan binding domain-containing protein, partial [Actinocrinis sp.]
LSLHDLIYGRPDPDTLLDLDGELAAEVSRRLSDRGFFGEVGTALEDWAGRENLEMRMVAGRLDPVVLNYLRTATGAAGA